MQQSLGSMAVGTHGRGLYEVTEEVAAWIAEQEVSDGLLTVFIRHTSASLLIQENADPDVMRDLDDFFARIAPEDNALYRHTAEGSDDMPAHIRAALTSSQLSIPVAAGRMALGTWQGIYVFEHRNGRFSRNLALHILGE
jgi:secondary thiamine-phosphate synthase enzyme